MSKPKFSITTDCVIITSNNKVLLVQRKKEPFKGEWALPGGFIDQEEPLEAGAKRELFEETGLRVDRLEQLKAFGNPERDPRGRVISIAFLGRIASESELTAGDDAGDAKWFELRGLPVLAFDHEEILRAAVNKIASEK